MQTCMTAVNCQLLNTTSEERLNGLVLLQIHQDLRVEVEQVLDELAKKSRRLGLRSPVVINVLFSVTMDIQHFNTFEMKSYRQETL